MPSLWQLALPAALLLAVPAAAQFDPGRQRLASDNVACLDRCDAAFRQCLGVRTDGGPRTPIPRRGEGGVPTPPPYEQCLLNRDVCVAECQLSLATARQRAERRGTR